MTKHFRNRAYHRDVKQRKYVSRLQKNAYWLWLDQVGEEKKRNFFDREHPKNWKELDEGCKFAKRFKNGGSPEVRDYYEKKWRQKESERKHGYPEDRKQMDDEDIQLMISGNWEDYCWACDKFNSDDCPFRYQVDIINNWKKDIKCNNFDD